LRHEGINLTPVRSRAFRIANLVSRGRLDDMQYVQFVTVARPLPNGPSASSDGPR